MSLINETFLRKSEKSTFKIHLKCGFRGVKKGGCQGGSSTMLSETAGPCHLPDEVKKNVSVVTSSNEIISFSKHF